MISQDFLKECLYYNEYSGVFTWRKRPESHFNSAKIAGNINGKMAGKTAGTVNTKGYRIIFINKQHYIASHLAWLYIHGHLPENEVDHIDRRRDNNAITNLRLATRTDNQRNKSRQRNNTSGVAGVNWMKDRCKWRASIGHLGKKIHLGFYDKKQDAIKARRKALIEHGYDKTHGIEYGE